MDPILDEAYEEDETLDDNGDKKANTEKDDESEDLRRLRRRILKMGAGKKAVTTGKESAKT